MGGNGDWYVMIVETEKKLGPSVRITTSGVHRDQRMVAPAMANLYRALGGEQPFVLVGDDLSLFEPEDEPNAIWESNYRRLGRDERPPIRAMSDGTIEMIVPSSWGGTNTWQRLSAEPAVVWAWRQVVEHLITTRGAPSDVFAAPPSPSSPPTPVAPTASAEEVKLRARIAELEADVTKAKTNEERWRRDAVEDKPAREVLKEVREVLGVREGEGVVEVAKRVLENLAEFKDVHVNIRPWMARAEKLMSPK